MSKACSALNGAIWSDGIATIKEMELQGMITLRGDLGNPAIRGAATSVSASDFPDPGHANCIETRGICWMSPDEVLVLCPYNNVAANIDKMKTTLGGVHSLCVDVSDARAMFTLSGPHAREVLAKLVPVDLAPDRFTTGMFRRTRIAQVPAAFWLHDTDCFHIICFRSQAQYVFDLLKVAAQPGSKVGVF